MKVWMLCFYVDEVDAEMANGVYSSLEKAMTAMMEIVYTEELADVFENMEKTYQSINSVWYKCENGFFYIKEVAIDEA
jgi:mevalonate pyrophosphate decarboxylase